MSNEEKIISLLTEIKELLERHYHLRNEASAAIKAQDLHRELEENVIKVVRRYS